MNTTTGVFGHSSGFSRTDGAAALGLGHLGAVRRHIQGVLIQGSGATGSTTSPRLSVTRAPSRGAAAATAGGAEAAYASHRADTDQRTAAQALVDAVRDASGLKLEEIATLLGITRRTLQHWRAGEAISSANEWRLRSLAKAVAALDAGKPQDTRRRLLDRVDGEVSAFDLLSEGRFDLAVAVALGRRPRAPATDGVGAGADLAARLSAIEDAQPIAAGVPSARRLRRKK